MKPDPDLRTSRLFDIRQDNDQLHPLSDPALEARMAEMLARALEEHGAPAEQFVRLGLREA